LEAIRLDRFPEAFRRFEEVVDIRRIESFRQLRLAFASWAGWNWRDTYMQNRALAVEARRVGIPVFVERRPVARRFYGRTAVTWRREVITVKGKSQTRYRDVRTGRFIKKPK
jgi:hypothetical protein